MGNKQTAYGRNYLGRALNFANYKIELEDLVNFYNDFNITIDKKLDLDFNYDPEGQTNEEKYHNLYEMISNIPFYQIQFFVFEKFELIGLKRNDLNFSSFMSMSRTPADNCGLTTNKLTEFLTLGLTEKVLDQSIITQELNSIYVRCQKFVNTNMEFFVMILKPDNNQECQMTVLQKDLGQSKFETMVLLDTYPLAEIKVSCMRYVRGVLQRANYILI